VLGLSGITQIAAGDASTCAVLSDGTAKCWGHNAAGELGDGTSIQSLTPVAVQGLSNVVDIALSTDLSYYACARLRDDTLWCWGANSAGQLGNGNTLDASGTPVAVTNFP